MQEGAQALLEHLRGKFGEYVPARTIAPQAINTQEGKFAPGE